MKKKKMFFCFLLLFMIFLWNAGESHCQDIAHNGEKWIQVRVAELDNNPVKYKYKNIYFEISRIRSSNHQSSYISKRFLCFKAYKGSSHIYLWVNKKQDKILDLFYDLAAVKDCGIGIFATVKRKKRSSYGKYEYFVIVKDCVRIE